jgi:hypothetical protein
MSTYDQAKQAIQSYSEVYRNSNRPSFDVSDLYNLFPEKITNTPTPNQWPATWPFNERQGVYIILDNKYEVCYVGKASMNNVLGSRLSSYFGYDEGRRCRLYHTWKSTPRFIFTVATPIDSAFEAASLEEFLIRELKPTDNSLGL